MKLKNIIENQRDFSNMGNLINIGHRINYLKILKDKIKNNRDAILEAISIDLGKASYESYLTEYQVLMGELEYLIKNLYNLAKNVNKGSSLNIAPGKAYLMKKPFGQVLIQSPWNYPFLLSMSPVIGAIGGGNTVILKTSRKVPETNKIIGEILKSLPRELVFFANDFTHDEILNEKYDFYFFTGSKRVGKIIYKKAAENLKPVVLELGVKSPCIVDEKVNIKDAAKKIAWGKFINSGQTCIAPDYLLVHINVKEALIKELSLEIDKRYNDENLTRIITKEKTEELSYLIKDREDIVGGKYNIEERVFKPTLLTEASFNDEIMKDEIFGPILPIIEYEDLDDIINIINERDTPLALYIFSKNQDNINKVQNYVNFGGGCINDVIIHVSEKKIPFGGMGESGLGSYHGKYSIDTFTNPTGIIKSPSGFSNPLRYPPYTDGKFNIIKKFLG